MFNIGPLELLVIFVVALLVIGPEKLPDAVRTSGLWIGRFRRSFHKIKAEVEKELRADEIKRQLHNESILADVEDAKKSASKFANDIKSIASESEVEEETDLRLKAEDKTATTSDPKSSEDTVTRKPPEKTEKAAEEKSIAGELKQAVSYVNDISRDVKKSTREIESEFSKPGTTPKSGEKK